MRGIHWPLCFHCLQSCLIWNRFSIICHEWTHEGRNEWRCALNNCLCVNWKNTGTAGHRKPLQQKLKPKSEQSKDGVLSCSFLDFKGMGIRSWEIRLDWSQNLKSRKKKIQKFKLEPLSKGPKRWKQDHGNVHLEVTYRVSILINSPKASRFPPSWGSRGRMNDSCFHRFNPIFSLVPQPAIYMGESDAWLLKIHKGSWNESFKPGYSRA